MQVDAIRGLIVALALSVLLYCLSKPCISKIDPVHCSMITVSLFHYAGTFYIPQALDKMPAPRVVVGKLTLTIRVMP